MTMRLLGWAILLIGLDPSLNGFDVLPDVAGWAIAFAVLEEQALAHPAAAPEYTHAKRAALVTAFVGAVLMALFFSEQPSDVLRGSLRLVEVLAALAATWGLLMGIAKASVGHEPALVFTARRLAVAMGGILLGRALLLAWMLAMDVSGGSGAASGGVVLRVLVALLEVCGWVGLAAFCFRIDGRAWLRPRPTPVAG